MHKLPRRMKNGQGVNEHYTSRILSLSIACLTNKISRGPEEAHGANTINKLPTNHAS